MYCSGWSIKGIKLLLLPKSIEVQPLGGNKHCRVRNSGSFCEKDNSESWNSARISMFCKKKKKNNNDDNRDAHDPLKIKCSKWWSHALVYCVLWRVHYMGRTSSQSTLPLKKRHPSSHILISCWLFSWSSVARVSVRTRTYLRPINWTELKKEVVPRWGYVLY